jgi:hypothetical protein
MFGNISFANGCSVLGGEAPRGAQMARSLRRRRAGVAQALVTTLSTASLKDSERQRCLARRRIGAHCLRSVFDVTGEGVDERVDCTVGELGAH